MNTPTWDGTFMETAEVWSKRSKCMYYKVAAVFTKGKRLLQIGYNGPPKGKINHCEEIGCAKEIDGEMLPPGSKLCRGAHAEMNGIVNAAAMGINLSGCKVYCTWSPCYDCTKHLVNLGITEFVYLKKYEEEFPQAEKLFKENNIVFRKFNKGGEK